MDAFLVVDMQVGLLAGEPKHDLQGVIDRINRVSAMLRGQSGKIVWIQHCGPAGDGHTLNDRPHLDASMVIRHHNWVWSDLLTHRSIRVVSTAELLAGG
jgi:nicotinamidase-related amidase